MQHDVDVVVEVDFPIGVDPEWMLNQLYIAVKGDPGSRYYDFKVERNSRCVTVTYPDGVTVDLMPVARISGGPEYSGVLFHHNAKRNEKYRKEVNPKAFTLHFNARIQSSDVFASRYRTRRLLADGLLQERAETQPMPEHVPIEEKSSRLMAIQLPNKISYRVRIFYRVPRLLDYTTVKQVQPPGLRRQPQADAERGRRAAPRVLACVRH